MSKLVVSSHAPDRTGNILRVTPESAGWNYVGFEVYQLEPGQQLERELAEQENCLVLMTGKADVTVGTQSWMDLGKRTDVFDGQRPYAVYVPAHSSWFVSAQTSLELAVCTAPAEGRLKPRLILPDDMSVEHRGHTNIRRTVHNILPEQESAENLLVVEVLVKDGNWSGYPPHKHDVDDLPRESSLEETYFHKVRPEEGFAFQRVYTTDGALDESIAVQNNHCVLVPKGYHPVVAPPRHDVYFINVMAGPVRTWRFTEHAVHAALMSD